MKHARRTLFALFCGIAIGAAGVAIFRPPVANSKGGIVGVSLAEAALDRPIPEIWLTDVPFQEAVRKLAELSGAAVAIDEASFRKASIDLNKRVTVKTRNVSVGEVLEDLAAAMSEQDKPVWAEADDYRIVLRVVDADSPDFSVTTRMYDVRELLEMMASRERDILPDFSLPINPPPAPFASTPRELAQEDLSNLLQGSVAPDTWREAGGSIGAIAFAGGHMIVTQAGRSQRDIRRELERIRRMVGPIVPSGPLLPEALRFNSEKNKWISYSSERGEAKLRQVMPEFQAADEPLWQAIERLAKTVDITLDADATLDSKLRGTKVSVGTRSATVGQTLRALLNAAVAKSTSTETPINELGWWLRGEVVVISTENEAKAHPLLRVYDVRHWLASTVIPATQPTTDASRPIAEVLLDEFSEVLQAHVAVDTWRTSGGNTGAIQRLGYQFFVTQTVENHEHVRRFLEAFRHPVIVPQPSSAAIPDKLDPKSPVADAESSQPPAGEEPEVFAHVYDVRPHLAVLLGQPVTRDVRRSMDYILARKMLLKTITDNVDVESWRENGGTVGSIGEVAGQLVVTQTRGGHLAVSKVLNELLRSEGALKELVDEPKK